LECSLKTQKSKQATANNSQEQNKENKSNTQTGDKRESNSFGSFSSQTDRLAKTTPSPKKEHTTAPSLTTHTCKTKQNKTTIQKHQKRQKNKTLSGKMYRWNVQSTTDRTSGRVKN